MNYVIMNAINELLKGYEVIGRSIPTKEAKTIVQGTEVTRELYSKYRRKIYKMKQFDTNRAK